MNSLNLIIVLSLVAAFSSVSRGQGKGQVTDPERPADSQSPLVTVAKGEIVSELGPAIWRVHHAANGDHWFGSQGRGVYRFDGKTLVNFTTKDGLYYDPVGGIQEDKSGNIYFATTFDVKSGRHVQGVSRFDGT